VAHHDRRNRTALLQDASKHVHVLVHGNRRLQARAISRPVRGRHFEPGSEFLGYRVEIAPETRLAVDEKNPDFVLLSCRRVIS
jgi:hypothetical protein